MKILIGIAIGVAGTLIVQKFKPQIVALIAKLKEKF